MSEDLADSAVEPKPSDVGAAATTSYENPYTGWVILRLRQTLTLVDVDDLLDPASGLVEVPGVLANFGVDRTQRCLHAWPAALLVEIESSLPTMPAPPAQVTGSLHDPNLYGLRVSTYWRVNVERLTNFEIAQLVEALIETDEVDLAYREVRAELADVMPPGGSAATPDPDSPGSQGYIKRGPNGVNARWVWRRPAGGGKGVGMVDVERAWCPDHDELLLFPHPIVGTMTTWSSQNEDHGTKVLGVLAARDNSKTIVGLAPKAKPVLMAATYDGTNAKVDHVGLGIFAAVVWRFLQWLPTGSVVLVEVQLQDPVDPFVYLPCEIDHVTYTAMLFAWIFGLHVVEPAGNAKTFVDPFLLGDSGAILVGAAIGNDPDHPRLGASNYGAAVKCYAWGSDFDSILCDPLANLEAFGHTSGAAAIIAGCVALVQGMHKSVVGSPLAPDDMRNALGDPANGTQSSTNAMDDAYGNTCNIGVMPDLRKVVVALGL